MREGLYNNPGFRFDLRKDILSPEKTVIRTPTTRYRQKPGQPEEQVIIEETIPKTPTVPQTCPRPPVAAPFERGYPHVELPPHGIWIFCEKSVQVPAAVLGPPLVPGIARVTMYTVPANFVAHIRWFDALLYDASYNTIYFSVIRQGGRTQAVEDEETQYGRRFLPLFPGGLAQNIRLDNYEHSAVGIELQNTLAAPRELWVAMGGWKSMEKCLEENIKV